MNIIQKIAAKIADAAFQVDGEKTVELSRATSIPLGIRRTRAQMETLKKY